MGGKTIRLYLVEGEPGGIMTAEIINWTGKAVVVPRSKLPGLAEREEAKRAGIYLLVGDDPENLSRKRVYVGESDNVFDRLKNHQTDVSKDFWTQSVFVTSKDENLTKSHVRYLEGRLIGLIASAKRAILANGTDPTVRGLPEPDVADMEFFLDQIRMLLPVLGFFFAQPTPTPKSKPTPKDENDKTYTKEAEPEIQDASPLFYMSPVGTYAIAQKIDNEFVVSEGSTTRKKGIQSWTSYCLLREQLLQDGKLAEDEQPDLLVLRRVFPFRARAPRPQSCLVAIRTAARPVKPKKARPTPSGKKRNWSRLLPSCRLNSHHIRSRR